MAQSTSWLASLAADLEPASARRRSSIATLSAVVIAGKRAGADRAGWFNGDEARLSVVGCDNPISGPPPGTEILRSLDERPRPAWVLGELADRGIRSLLLEGGPHLNASFLAEDLIDEVYWTVGAHLSSAPMRCRW